VGTGTPTWTTPFSGSYTDLTDKPTIDASETKITAGQNITITGSGTTVSLMLSYNNTLYW